MCITLYYANVSQTRVREGTAGGCEFNGKLIINTTVKIIKIKHLLKIYIYCMCVCVTLEHKTSHNGQFILIEMCASSEIRINNISIDVWFVMIGQYL